MTPDNDALSSPPFLMISSNFVDEQRGKEWTNCDSHSQSTFMLYSERAVSCKVIHLSTFAPKFSHPSLWSAVGLRSTHQIQGQNKPVNTTYRQIHTLTLCLNPPPLSLSLSNSLVLRLSSPLSLPPFTARRATHQNLYTHRDRCEPGRRRPAFSIHHVRVAQPLLDPKPKTSVIRTTHSGNYPQEETSSQPGCRSQDMSNGVKH